MSCKWLAAGMLFVSSCSARDDQVKLILQPNVNPSDSIDGVVTAVAKDADMKVTKKELAGAPAFVMRSATDIVLVQGSSKCTNGRGAVIPCPPSAPHRVLIERAFAFPANPKPLAIAQMFMMEASKRGWLAFVIPKRAEVSR